MSGRDGDNGDCWSRYSLDMLQSKVTEAYYTVEFTSAEKVMVIWTSIRQKKQFFCEYGDLRGK
ncbi:hypothetical protein FRX31_014864 [Thalictrum thalictroides]|uniref:Uncharacterized protein n=1 Tax=Thalictrum thalictroides TaxID=46969 RepID=A0A7J6WFD7_THATH|nr:hypothetical protein FRX31_014864 [Thalictrum thalictroides]